LLHCFQSKRSQIIYLCIIFIFFPLCLIFFILLLYKGKYFDRSWNLNDESCTFVAGKFRKEFKRTFPCSHNDETCIHKRGYVAGVSDPLKQRSQNYTRSIHINNNNVQQSTEVIPLSAIINIPQNEKQEWASFLVS